MKIETKICWMNLSAQSTTNFWGWFLYFFFGIIGHKLISKFLFGFDTDTEFIDLLYYMEFMLKLLHILWYDNKPQKRWEGPHPNLQFMFKLKLYVSTGKKAIRFLLIDRNQSFETLTRNIIQPFFRYFLSKIMTM